MYGRWTSTKLFEHLWTILDASYIEIHIVIYVCGIERNKIADKMLEEKFLIMRYKLSIVG